MFRILLKVHHYKYQLLQWEWEVIYDSQAVHHPDNETELPLGTALLPGMVLCVIIQTMRLNDFMAPCCQTLFYVSSSRQ